MSRLTRINKNEKCKECRISEEIKSNKGITIIALAVTIVVLIILAGISIQMLVGQTGLIEQARQSQMEEKREEYREKLNLIGVDLLESKVTGGIEEREEREYLERYKNEIEKDELFENAQRIEINEDGDELIVITEEGWAFEITEEYVEYLGNINDKDFDKMLKAEVEIQEDPKDITTAEGNKVAFNVKATGIVRLKYQWYSSKTNNNSNGEKIVGATTENYKITASNEKNENYYYCEVTAISPVTFDKKIVTSNAAKLTVTEANYSITKGEENIYYSTLQEAYDNAISGKGDTGGGTITLLRDIEETVITPRPEISETETCCIIINKDIAINTNNFKLTISSGIHVDSGTLHIKGNGEIYCKEDKTAIKSYGGNIETSGSPTIRSEGVVIYMCDKLDVINEAKMTLNGGYIIGEGRSGIQIYPSGSGEIIINDTIIVGKKDEKNGFSTGRQSKNPVTIKGKSIIASGMIDTNGNSGAISYQGDGNLTIEGDTIITSCLYGGPGINIYKPITVTIKDNASIYSGSVGGSRAIALLETSTNGITFNINTEGNLYGKSGVSVIDFDGTVTSTTVNITKGSFCCQYKEPLLALKKYMGNYPGEGTLQDVEFPYFEEDCNTLNYYPAKEYVVNVGK